MLLRVVEDGEGGGAFRDVRIGEGEMFLLPGGYRYLRLLRFGDENEI